MEQFLWAHDRWAAGFLLQDVTCEVESSSNSYQDCYYVVITIRTAMCVCIYLIAHGRPHNENIFIYLLYPMLSESAIESR